MRLAHRALEVGQPQQAEASWRRAIQANPIDPAPRQALASIPHRPDIATTKPSTLTESSLKLTPQRCQPPRRSRLPHPAPRPHRRGSRQLGPSSRRRPRSSTSLISTSPTNSIAKASPATLLPPTTILSSARLHNCSRRIVQRPTKSSPSHMRMADCQARSSQPELALKSYSLAEKLAAQTRQPNLESLADVNEAALQSKSGNSRLRSSALPARHRARQPNLRRRRQRRRLVRLRKISRRLRLLPASRLCLHPEIGLRVAITQPRRDPARPRRNPAANRKAPRPIRCGGSPRISKQPRPRSATGLGATPLDRQRGTLALTIF